VVCDNVTRVTRLRSFVDGSDDRWHVSKLDTRTDQVEREQVGRNAPPATENRSV
jgi:hypothetical protein